ncbi:MAG: thrombospondin type 3 repeat-containing protein [Oligoflexus sp.]|nr:thrombospondin type 3 repeat-containing protein [Oligoflexus sp.]
MTRFLILFLILTLSASCQKKSSHSPASPEKAPVAGSVTNPNDPNFPLLPLEACSKELESKATDKTCEVMHKGNGSTYIEGTLLTADLVTPRGGVLFDAAGVISCSGCGCLDEAKAADATIISCPQGIISPGLINSHDHLSWANVAPQSAGSERFEHRNDWRGGKRGHHKISVPSGGATPEVTFGEIRQLMVGTVSIAGSNGAPGFLRNLDDANQMEGLISEELAYDTFPLESGGDYAFRVGDCAYSRQSSLDYLQFGRHLMHVSEGIDDAARNEFLCLSGGQAGGFDATKPRNTYVHAIGLVAADAEKLGAEGTAVVWSPRSNISLYGNTASVTLLKNQGVNVALGTDWVPSGSAHLLREMQCAADLSEHNFGGALSDRDLWLMMTTKAAAAMKVERQVGRIARGYIADIAIYRDLKAKNAYRSIMQSEAKDTALVLRGGKALYGDAELLGAMGTSCSTVDICGVQKSLCFEQETKGLATDGSLPDLAALVTKMQASAAAYPLFFCEKPKDEPSCVPERTGEYNGINTVDDSDGDGVKNAADNCPQIFNPIRPLDAGKQADADNDGVGDVCDLCPLSADNSSCKAVSDDDRDHDNIIDILDNCPINANPLQEDVDHDGVGDICDGCPEISNPNASACLVNSIHIFANSLEHPDLLSSLRPKASVEVSGLVSAIAKTGYYLQDEAIRSATFVYLPKGDKPKVGQRVRIKGTFDVFLGEAQITNSKIMESIDGTALQPFPVTVNDIENIALNGVLVAYEGKVSSGTPSSNGAYQETFRLAQVVRIGSYLTTYPTPFIGDTYKIAGILRHVGTTFYIEPRTVSDILLVKSGETRVSQLTPALGFAELSSTTITNLTLTLDRPATSETTVTLKSSDSKLVALAGTVVIPQGQTIAQILLQFGSAPIDGPVTITASLGESAAGAQIQLLKTFTPHWVGSESQKLSTWVGQTTVISLPTDMPQSFSTPSKIAVTYDNAAVEVLSEATLVAGSSKAEIKIKGLKDGESHLVLELNGSKVDYLLTTRKQDLTITEIFYDPTGEDTNLEWVEIRNTSGTELDLSQYMIGAGGATYATLQYPLKGTLSVDGCVVIGGPLSSEKNAFPVFFQAEAFKGGIQNGGPAADAIGIFHKAVLDAKSVPIDVFAYGDLNKDAFLGKEGVPLTPDLPLVKSGASAERHGQVWVEQIKPTPGDCSALSL